MTAVVRGGLGRLAANSVAPHQLVTQIDCADTILSAAGGGPLIEQLSDDGVEDLRDRLVWTGDRNFYEGFEVFWLVRRVDSDLPGDVMPLDLWKSFWGPEHENFPQWGKVSWRTPAAADRPLHRHVPADYLLSDAPGNPSRGTASDGRISAVCSNGCRSRRQPNHPPPSRARPPSRRPAAPRAGPHVTPRRGDPGYSEPVDRCFHLFLVRGRSFRQCRTGRLQRCQ